MRNKNNKKNYRIHFIVAQIIVVVLLLILIFQWIVPNTSNSCSKYQSGGKYDYNKLVMQYNELSSSFNALRNKCDSTTIDDAELANACAQNYENFRVICKSNYDELVNKYNNLSLDCKQLANECKDMGDYCNSVVDNYNKLVSESEKSDKILTYMGALTNLFNSIGSITTVVSS